MATSSWAAGSIPAGGDVYTRSTVVTPFTAAAKYDPNTRTMVVSTVDGSLEIVHWVDQAVALALSVPLGSVPSVPDLGLDFGAVRKANHANAQRVVQDAVSRALGRLISLKLVKLGAIVVKWSNGTIQWITNYTNLALPTPQNRMFPPKAGA